MPAPDRTSFVIAEDEGVVPLHHLARQDEVSIALLDFRTRDGELVALAEIHSHVVEKRLGAEEDVNRISAALQGQVNRLFFASLRWHLHFVDNSLNFSFGVKVVLGRSGWVWRFLGGYRCDQKQKDEKGG